MNPTFPGRTACVLSLMGLLSACGAAPDTGSGASADTEVTVTTAIPVRQTFHDLIEALGSAMGDPHHARAVSLAYGGQIVAVKVTAGQTVSSGQPMLTIAADPATLSAFKQAQTALTLSQGELTRTAQLATERLATQSQLAAARKALADAQVALEAQRALGGGAAEQIIAAPANGVVTALSVGLGERVAANAPLLSFTPAHSLVAMLGVQPESGAQLHVGMAVQLHGVYGSSKDFIGTLSMVGQAVDPQTHLLPAQVELPASASSTLVAGAALSAEIRTSDFNAWAVPRAAVLNDQHGDYLFQVNHGRAKRIDVKLLSPDGQTLGVEGPLNAQAGVIVLGVYELNDGDAVKEQSAKEPASQKPTTAASPPPKTPAAAKPGAPQ